MCNAYTVRPKVGARALAAVVSEEISKLPSSLVRRTGSGVVVRSDGTGLSPEIMRWGFHRPFSDAINNARSDKFSSPTWADSLRLRRCLVPISTFYEWQPLVGKAKQTFEFKRPDGEWMWVAGLFEHSDKYGPCFATITTEPPEWVVPIHDRLLAVVDFDDGLAFLHGETLPFGPYAGKIEAVPCESPLKRKGPGPPQGELF
ncbi:MAG: hypothetical protein RLZZ214_3712 [Verrucomicrobiota bacterium]|jgi:putative SOS response-associated peptidase YedK